MLLKACHYTKQNRNRYPGTAESRNILNFSNTYSYGLVLICMPCKLKQTLVLGVCLGPNSSGTLSILTALRRANAMFGWSCVLWTRGCIRLFCVTKVLQSAGYMYCFLTHEISKMERSFVGLPQLPLSLSKILFHVSQITAGLSVSCHSI